MEYFVLGSVVTVLVALLFYLLGRRDGAQLLRQKTIALRALESAGLVDLNRDPKGQIIGIAHHVTVTDSGLAHDSISATLTLRLVT